MLKMQTFHQSIQESSVDSPSSNSIQVIHHVFNNVLEIIEVDRTSVPNWMECMHYHNINELCDDLQFELEYIHHYNDYIVNGQHCELKFSTMGRIRLFISWMSTRKKGNTFQVSSQYHLSRTHQDFIKFKQENMIRIFKEQAASKPTSQPHFKKQDNISLPIPLY